MHVAIYARPKCNTTVIEVATCTSLVRRRAPRLDTGKNRTTPPCHPLKFTLFNRDARVVPLPHHTLARPQSLKSFSAVLHHSEAACVVHAPQSPSCAGEKKKKKRKKEKAGEERVESSGSREGGGSDVGLTIEAMLALRPALDIHGWLLDLDTR